MTIANILSRACALRLFGKARAAFPLRVAGALAAGC